MRPFLLSTTFVVLAQRIPLNGVVSDYYQARNPTIGLMFLTSICLFALVISA